MTHLHDDKKFQKDNVSWQVFVWAMGIFLVIVGYGASKIYAMEERETKRLEAINEIRVQLQDIRTNIEWIRGTLELRQFKK
jgi:hypothetical protein